MIPLAHIQIKHTEGDELEYVHNGKPFVGFYIETRDNQFYEGTNNIILGLPLQPKIEDMAKNPQPTKRVLKYNLFKQKVKKFLSNTLPIPVMKRPPTKDNYQKGFMIRYFAKRIHNTGYFEIEKTTYDKINSKDGTYDHNLYIIGRIKWFLVDNVFKDNALSLKQTELKFPNISYLFPLLNEYFRPTLEDKENLHTDGGELYYADGSEYIGAYHIHKSQGPMVGAYHQNAPHPKLYYLNKLPTPNNMTYENWLQNFNNNPIGVYAEPDRGSGLIDPDPILSQHFSNASYNCHSTWTDAPAGYTGITNSQGQVPRGTACIDPGDGTGTYSWAEYGENALYTCETNCSEMQDLLIPIEGTGGPGAIPIEGTGCMYPFDPLYCAGCGQHSPTMCMFTYNTNTYPGACFCGNYGGFKWYHTSCC